MEVCSYVMRATLGKWQVEGSDILIFDGGNSIDNAPNWNKTKKKHYKHVIEIRGGKYQKDELKELKVITLGSKKWEVGGNLYFQ